MIQIKNLDHLVLTVKDIDKTDIDESDQIGLSSFYYFNFGVGPQMNDDNRLWDEMLPGYFNNSIQNTDADFLFSSGYFPLLKQQTERFSIALYKLFITKIIILQRLQISQKFGRLQAMDMLPFIGMIKLNFLKIELQVKTLRDTKFIELLTQNGLIQVR